MNIMFKGTWLMLLFAALAIGACTDSNDQESKFAKVFSDLNKDWQLYEIKKKGNFTIIRVDVSDNVPFKEAKKAMEAIQKIDPKLAGYIEFYNSQVGIVLRKVEIIPVT